jgi:hypothetical protein
MHDKMDYAKITFPMFLHKTKKLNGLMKLLHLVTEMLAHGNGDGRYAYYGLHICT